MRKSSRLFDKKLNLSHKMYEELSANCWKIKNILEKNVWKQREGKKMNRQLPSAERSRNISALKENYIVFTKTTGNTVIFSSVHTFLSLAFMYNKIKSETEQNKYTCSVYWVSGRRINIKRLTLSYSSKVIAYYVLSRGFLEKKPVICSQRPMLPIQWCGTACCRE